MLGYITFALSVVATILHFIKPKTKTKVDDQISDVVDEAQKVLPVVAPLVGLADKAQDPKAGPQVTDHRSK